MRALTAGDEIGGKWRIVRPAFGDAPGSEFRVEPVAGGGARRLTLWRVWRAPTPAELERLGRVMCSSVREKHPAFPPVEGLGFDANREALWMVREWRHGESLPSALGGLHPIGLDLPLLRSIAEQLAEALATAHAAGIVHGRLRPSRLFVTQTPRGVRLSVLDLGLESFRREAGHGWLSASQVGAAYLAPESERPGPLSPAADVFSLGLIVRDMLATRRDGAWRGRWECWVERATAAAPGDRFPHVTDALGALLPVLRALPDPLPPPPPNHAPEPPTSE